MRILTRYILKEIASYSFIGLVIFTFIIYIPRISQLLEVVARRNLPAFTILLLFLAPIPEILALTIPMAVLVGVLLGLSRLAADGEVIAARAVGVGVGRFARPVMSYAVAGWLLAMGMSLYLAPKSNLELTRKEAEVRNSQAAYEIQPRVFIEQFPGRLLYIQDIVRNRWRNIFVAETGGTATGGPKVTLAEAGTLINDPRRGGLVLHLEDGAMHEINPQDAARYSVTSYSETDIPLPPPPSTDAAALPRSPKLQNAQTLLQAAAHSSDAQQRRAAQVELNYRLALPMAALVFALVAMPLGMFSRKGGKAVGVMATILLVFLYYIIMAFGTNLAKQGRLSPVVGLWVANFVFAVGGLLMTTLMRRARAGFLHQEWIGELGRAISRIWQRRRPVSVGAPTRARAPGSRFFQILDVYVMRSWFLYFALLLVSFVGVYIVFDFFQLLGDIVRNHAGAALVLSYYRYLCPYVVYLMLPLTVLMATLVNFSLLTKTSQITAVKAVGVSLYRLSFPVMAAAGLLSAGMFLLGDQYLPESNQRQSAYRNEIKGRPPQTYRTPDLQWIFGKSNSIYNYRFFDPNHDVFANLSVFEFDPASFHLTRRIYAERALWEPHMAGWVLESGWVRDLDGSKVTAYRTFPVATFSELTEPPEYFKKEVKTSEQMSAVELRSYIRELRQSGFDVVPLSVQLERKFSYPLIALVVGLIGIPFSFTAGRKGALTGVAVSIGIAIVYWSVSSLFEAMGNLGQLPPTVAAWSPDILFAVGGIYLLLRVRT